MNILFWIIFTILVLIYLFIIMNLLKMRKVQIFRYYHNDFENYDLDKLKTKFRLAYKKYNKSQFELFNDLSDEIEFLENSIYKIILKDYDSLFKNLKKFYLNLFNYENFKKLIKNLEERQERYKIKYLNVVFELNELNLNYEIKDNILVLTKDIYGEIKGIINKSKYYNQIINSPLNEYILDIENNIELLEKKTLSMEGIEEFEKLSKELLLKIEYFYKKIKFHLETINYLVETIPKYNKQLRELLTKDNDAFQFYIKDWKKEITNIKKVIKYVENNIFLKNRDKLKEYIEDSKKQILAILREAKDADYVYLFILDFQLKVDFLVTGLESKYQKIIYDIDKYFLLEKKEKSANIKKIFNEIENYYKSFSIKIKNGFKENTPRDVFNILKKLIISAKDFFAETNKLILDIKLVIEQANNINEKIYEMNNRLLNVELKMKNLPERIQLVNESKFNKHQNRVSEFIQNYKDKFIMLEKNKTIELNYELSNIRDFYNDIYSKTYLYNYIEWLIISLNKYRSNKKIDGLIEMIQNNYIHGNLSESLRIADRIIDIYKIYE